MKSRLVTTQKIVETAAALFLQHGFNAVSMDQIAGAAQVTKMTVYQHFRSKEILLLHCLRWRLEKREQYLDEHFKGLQPSNTQALDVFNWMAEREAKRGFHGCAFLKATQEMGATLPEVRAIAVEAKRLMRNRLVGMLQTASFSNAERLGEALSLLLEGAQALSLIEQSPKPLEAARREAEGLLASNIND